MDIEEHQLKLGTAHNDYITYKIINESQRHKLNLVYLHGFAGDMCGTKGMLMEKLAYQYGLRLIKFNYLGHGTSAGKLTDFIFTDWWQNVTAVIEQLVTAPMLVAGNSMGGWLAFLAALHYKENCLGVLSISTAVDFLTEVVEMQLPQTALQNDIIYEMLDYRQQPSGICITKNLWQDSKQYNLFKLPIDLQCPIHMIHGGLDPLIPYDLVLKFVRTKLTQQQVELKLLNDADHSMSKPHHLQAIADSLAELIAQIS